MKNTLVAYYSRTGSNQYLAQKVAEALNCEIAPIDPRPRAFFWLIILSWFGMGAKPRLSKEQLAQYDRIIVCGPIWMGTLVAPLRGLLQQLKNDQQEICHITCCGSRDEKKDETFGYGTVFPKVRKIVGERLILSEAFPIVLVLPEDQREDDELIMNTRLSDDNFHGEIQERLDCFVQQLQQKDRPALV